MSSFRQLQIVFCLFFAAALLSACSESESPQPQQASQDLVAIGAGEAPVGQLDKSLMPRRYRLELTVDPRQDRFSGQTEIDVTLTEPRDQLWLHGKNLEVTDVWLSNDSAGRIAATYEEKLESGVALITLERPVAAGAATLHFSYSAPFNTSSNALFKIVRGEDAYAATQFEPIAARQVFPGFDEPGFKVSFDLALVTQADDVAVTTTPEKTLTVLDGGMVRRIYETTRPMPTYLLAFAVGPYDLVDYGVIPPNDIRDRPLPLRGVTARGQGERMRYALEQTGGILTALEEYFGMPYPYRKLDLIAIPESFGGAMENVGAITYDEWLVLMDETSSLDQRRATVAVQAHEMAHMWFGNLVTPDWWTDIWLNESFATWMSYKAANAYWPEGQYNRSTLKGALGAMQNDSLAAAREIREPITNSDNIIGAFDGITYQKGGGVLAMLERYIGEEGFQKGIRLHMERHADGNANADGFIASVAEGSGVGEIDAAFKSFIGQPGVPLVSVEVNCAEGQQPSIEVSQSRYAPLGSGIDPSASQWLIPMCISYDSDGARESNCTMLRESNQTIMLDSDTCPSQLLPNADGAGYYRFTMNESWMDGLVERASSLSAPEALVLVDSLDASFRSGQTRASSYVPGMATLVNHPDWDVAQAAMDKLESSINVLSAEEQDLVSSGLGNIIKPRYLQLAGASDEGSEILRQRMQRFLVAVAKDQELRAPLAGQAAARIGLNGEPDPAAVPVDEMETAFSVGVQDLGEPFFDLLLAQSLASGDPGFRNAAFGALARVEDPVLIAKLQAAILDGAFNGAELVGILFRQMARSASSELTYNWLVANDEAITNMIPQHFLSGVFPGLGSNFCSTDRADEWETFVKSRADKLPGYERELAQATESIRLCAALKEAQGADLLAVLETYR
jgi:alanyl aminopeptidase